MTWQTKPISDVFAVVGGGTPSKKRPEYYGGEIPWATIRDMHSSELATTEHTITEEGLQASSAKVIPAGEVIMASRVGLGKACLLNQSTAINQDIRALLPKHRDAIDRRFCLYWLQSIEDVIIGAGSGATVQGVKLPFIKALPFPDVGLEEQKRIVAVLDQAFAALDRARALAEANLADAEELFERIRSTLLQRLSVEAPTEKMGALVAFLNGDRGKNYPNKSEYVPYGISWINTGHIKPDGTLADEKMNFITQAKFDQLGGGKTRNGDIVFCLRGATIGKTALVGRHVPGAVASSLMIIRPSAKVIDKFVYYFLTSELGKNEIERFIGGAAQPNLAGKSVGQFNVPIVSIEKQIELVGQLDKARTNCSRLAEELAGKIADLADLRQSLLQKAFTGELT
ncbi:MAG: restriction endonuclease subunit S [Erythrobacter sp.]